jgi:hypothetical protein
VIHLLGKCLVKWTASQNFDALLLWGCFICSWNWLLSNHGNDPKHQDHGWHQDHQVTR